MTNPHPIPIMRFNPAADGLLRWLGPLEAACMAYVWSEARPLTTKRVWRELGLIYGPSRCHSTVATTMQRLVTKGLLSCVSVGRYWTHTYTPTCTEAEFIELQVAAILRSVEA